MWAKIIEMLQLSIREVWAIEKFFEYFGNLFTIVFKYSVICYCTGTYNHIFTQKVCFTHSCYG